MLKMAVTNSPSPMKWSQKRQKGRFPDSCRNKRANYGRILFFAQNRLCSAGRQPLTRHNYRIESLVEGSGDNKTIPLRDN